MKIRELHHSNVLIIPDSAEEKKVRGVIHPAKAVERQQTQPTGEVIMVGPGNKDNPVTVKVGDRVLYGQAINLNIQHEDGETEAHLTDMRAIVATVD
jgi:chaperonin GroES